MGEQWSKCKTDLGQLRVDIHNMSCRSQLYKLLRDELTSLGYWKPKARWYPKGFVKSKNAKNI
jgi:hypothetical protein